MFWRQNSCHGIGEVVDVVVSCNVGGAALSFFCFDLALYFPNDGNPFLCLSPFYHFPFPHIYIINQPFSFRPYSCKKNIYTHNKVPPGINSSLVSYIYLRISNVKFVVFGWFKPTNYKPTV